MITSLANPNVKNVLQDLYADAHTNDRLHREHLNMSQIQQTTGFERFKAMQNIYMPIDIEFGNLLYAFMTTARAKTVVEFGTSFGISTLFLASAVQDNGGGTVITTEFIPEKAERAKKNLKQAGLDSVVDFRVGDALKTLATSLPKEIDFVLLDGEKTLYMDILKLIEPNLRSGAIIASDNTDHDGLDEFLAYLRNPKNGYISSAMMTPDRSMARPHEISVRL